MAGYTRQSAANMVSDAVIYASDFNNEFNALQSAFDGASGHAHDGTTGNGPKINLSTSVTGILPAANGGLGGINKLDATTNPTVSDDANDGYVIGSLWVNVTDDLLFFLLDSTPGAAVWVRYQPYHAALASIASLTTSGDKMIYTTASNTYAVTALTAFSRSLLDDADASTALSTLGVSDYAKTLLDDPDAATARSTLGLGTMAIQNSSSVTVTGGSITGITDLAVADGGTGASTAANARTNLGVAIGSDVQAYNAALASIAGLTTSANQMIYTTAANTYATTALTAYARSNILTATSGSDLLSLAGAVPTSRTITAGTGLTGGGDLSANRTLAVSYGTTAGTAAQGNDSRLSDSREWTADTVSQAEAEAGTATTRRAWTAERVAQAIVALAPRGGVLYDQTFLVSGSLAKDPAWPANALVVAEYWSGGAGGAPNNTRSGGGGGGGYWRHEFTVADLGASEPFVVGSGGAVGGAGGVTSFKGISVLGGTTGTSVSSPSTNPADGGSGGSVSASRPNDGTLSGGNGGNASTTIGSPGGASIYGGGGGGGAGATNGVGGSSVFAGKGGNVAQAGTAPSGGGGARAVGADGQFRVRVIA